MNITFNKDFFTSLLLVIVISAIVYRITPVYVEKNIKVIISKNKGAIANIYQPRNIDTTREVIIDKLNLIHKGKFGHPKLGNIAKASEEFFLDVDQWFNVEKSGNYVFKVGSDDGFTLNIDGKKLCEHLADRPYSIDTCSIFLNKGAHHLAASYFQGYGNSGFTLEYQFEDGSAYWFGENSAALTLIDPPKP
jgi:hypothetical protein